QFKKKLKERLENPHVPSSKLRGYDSVYKIKLRTAGYRLAYEVIDNEVVVYVLAVGKRDKDAVYKKLASRFS
ncbi:type II toxin-antitoxin system RelE/ParE family toxin, partial [Vibrio metschnikovii]